MKKEAKMHNIDARTAEFGAVQTESESPYHEVFQESEVPLHEVHEMATAFGEVLEIQLASELLSVTNEAEMEQFLGGLMRRAWSGIRRAASSPVGQALTGVLKRTARVAIPMFGRAVGSYLGGPAGGAIVGTLASRAASAFGLETEGLSHEDRNFELARRFVRLAGVTANNAALIYPAGNPQAVANSALISAARRYAPGLLRGAPASITGTTIARTPTATIPTATTPATGISGPRRSGRWVRQGRAIIVFGA